MLSPPVTENNSICLADVYDPIFDSVLPKLLCRSGGVFGWRRKVWREGGALRDMEDSVPSLPCHVTARRV